MTMAANQPSNTVSYVVRRARRDDIDDLYRLIVALADHEKESTPTIMKDIILEDAFGERPSLEFIVGEFQPLASDGIDGAEERTVVGFASMCTSNHNIFHGRSAFLSGLYIDEAHRGIGLGGAIMKAVCKACVDLGLVQLDFDALSTNLRTRKFYSSLGVTNNTEKKNWEYWQFLRADMKKFTSNIEPECPNGVGIKIL